MDLSKKFNFAAQRVLFTYKTYLDKDDYLVWFKHAIDCDVKFIRLAHECPDDDAPYEHTHVVVDIGRRYQTIKERFFDYEDIHPHIRVLKNKKAFEDAKKYIAKQDPDNADLKMSDMEKRIDRILECSNPIEAVRSEAKSMKDVTAVLAVHGLKGYDFRTEGYKLELHYFEPYPWQREMWDIICSTKPTGRSIFWVYQKKGNVGKSVFGEWIEEMDPVGWKQIDDMGTSRDAATIILNMLTSGWTAKGLIVDLTRNAEDHNRMYDYFERIANGRMSSQKYSGRPILFNKPYVVVTANYLPKFHCMSLDRWKIFEVKEDLTLRHLTTDEAIEEQRKQKVHDLPNGDFLSKKLFVNCDFD